MFAIICLNVMLLISCWYLIAENQKNKSKINGLEDDLNKAIKKTISIRRGSDSKIVVADPKSRFLRLLPV